jgi:mRNA-degrading endonuclease toxin of MazEF toxin-antitoxin module
MTNYRPGDLVLVEFPFVEGKSGKRRPALVVANTGDEDVLLARVTTQDHHTPFDAPIAAWKSGGLLAPSFVRLHKLATIDKKLVLRRLGVLAEPDHKNVARLLTQLLSGW